jgi:hypothetical protein
LQSKGFGGRIVVVLVVLVETEAVDACPHGPILYSISSLILKVDFKILFT